MKQWFSGIGKQRQCKRMISERSKEMRPSFCSILLSGESFHTAAQKERTQAEPGSLPRRKDRVESLGRPRWLKRQTGHRAEHQRGDGGTLPSILLLSID